MKTGMLFVGSARKLLSIEPLASNTSSSAPPVQSFSPSASHIPQFLLNSSKPLETLLDSNGSTSSDVGGSPYDLPSRFNPSMAIIIVVLLSAFFIMGFFSVYVKRCTTEDEFDTNNVNTRRTAGVRRQERPPQGLDRSVVENLPVVTYSIMKGSKEGKEAKECVVCLSEFEEDETLRLLPTCGHTFHQECIDMWLFSHTTCPLCRQSLLPGSGSSAHEAAAPSGETTPRPTDEALEHENAQVVISIDGIPSREMQSGMDVGFQAQRAGIGAMHGFRGGHSLLEEANSSDGQAHYGSPIHGLTEYSPSGKKRIVGGARELRRSHSTGHSLVRGDGDHMLYSTLTASHAEIDRPFSFRSPLLAADFHRSRSYTTMSDLWGTQESGLETNGNFVPGEQKIFHSTIDATEMQAVREDLKGWSYYLKRTFSLRRTSSDARGGLYSSNMADASSSEASTGLNSEAKPALLSSSSMRRTLKRLAGM